ncbi:zf-HC2 domain-containing protein [Risungbinella massiliensis]|uniref:zf-HC2 domain-containing protein n=1 Tax=Risungbinella massiliensis TaxID=1329796 RepID=UPI0005CBFACD|nr:zf-HC2 domain-containing protein [Risungbinella massiliensis]
MENHWSCEEVKIFLPELVRDRLPIQETIEIRDHLQTCSLCQTAYFVAMEDEQRFSVLFRSSVVNEEETAKQPNNCSSDIKLVLPNHQNNTSDFIWIQLVGRIAGSISIFVIGFVLYWLYQNQLQLSLQAFFEDTNGTSLLYHWWAVLYSLPDAILGWLPETWLFLLRNLFSLLVPIGTAWFLYGLFFWKTNEEVAG